MRDCTNLKSIHLFGNNVSKIPSYKMKIREILPNINTIDADHLRTVNIKETGENINIKSVLKKKVNLI